MGWREDGAKPCPFCGCESIYIGVESAMSYYARCNECRARTKSVELPDRWPPEELGPIPDEIGEQGECKDGTYWGTVENYLLDIVAKAWNRRTEEKKDEV